MRNATIISIIFLCFSPVFAQLTDTLTPSNSLSINQTLISAGRKFELGFFNRGNPKRYYVGIWYKDITSNVIVWVANRDSPSYSVSSIFKLENQSNIVLFDSGSVIIWKTHPSNGVNPVLQLLDTGNLVVREAGDRNPDNYIWQSFDNPTDTLIPGQKFGWNLSIGSNQLLSSWRADDDPGTGNYTFDLDYKGDPEIYMRSGDVIIYRSGPWVGQRFSGVREMRLGNGGFNFTFYTGSDAVYYIFELPDDDRVKSRITVTYDGRFQWWSWLPDANVWNDYWYARKDQCDYYRSCGAYGVCNISAVFVCQCPQGFKPGNAYEWSLRDGSNGCVRDTRLDCGSDGFLQLDNMKLPETLTAYVDSTLDLDQCRDSCRSTCSCMAYASSEFAYGVGAGCITWTDELTDMRVFGEGGQTLYIRMAASDLGISNQQQHKPGGSVTGRSSRWKVMVIVVVIMGTAVIGVCMCYLGIKWLRRKYGVRRTRKETRQDNLMLNGDRDDAEFGDLPTFELEKLVAATKNFQESNKLGRGGFGTVYKGELEDGVEVAVKRLSKVSGQGLTEFMTEVLVISKLQHRNLVRLLGCCVQGEEKLLVYEYMPNKSLDALLFDQLLEELLGWNTRFNIIQGICRGLLYLHRDSRLRIIHRDLKASNILLDEKLNPKISDFGMARIFAGNEDQADTNRVVGTYGYMSPEYAMEGRFSEKSDVFSFGVLLLEIVSGRRNSSFKDEESLSLLGHAWKLWNEDDIVSLIDPSILESSFQVEILRCIQVALLCVQELPEDRPNMSMVISMIDSEVSPLPHPTQPGFTQRRYPSHNNAIENETVYGSVNRVSLSYISGR